MAGRPLPGEDYPSLEEIDRRTAEHWDWESLHSKEGLPLPVPRPGWLKCRHCGRGDFVYRNWHYFHRTSKTRRSSRCDFSIKCSHCALAQQVNQLDWMGKRTVGTHGIMVPESVQEIVDRVMREHGDKALHVQASDV
jgi:hypothetical protein